jgi:hypothetical protein
MKTNAVKATLYLRSQMKFFLYYLHFFFNLGTSQDNRCTHIFTEYVLHKNRYNDRHTILTGANVLLPIFPHLLSDISKIKHFPFLRPSPYNDSEPPRSYSWTLLPSDFHLEGPRDGDSGATGTMGGDVQQINAYMVAECYNRLLLQQHIQGVPGGM